NETAQWTPPYVAQTLTAPRQVGWRNLGQVLKELEKARSKGVNGWEPKAALEEIVATWSCGIYEVEELNSLTEYKRSWSRPSDMKVYHFVRFKAKMDTCIPRALADPDSRKG